MRVALLARLTFATVTLGGALLTSLAQAEPRGGFEIAVAIPQGKDPHQAHATFVRTLVEQFGMKSPDGFWVQDPKTGAFFNVIIDGPAIELSTPPMEPEQVEAVLAPIFAASKKLGWTHTAGGGHIHLDNAPFAQSPVKFVNMLTWLHDHPEADQGFLKSMAEPSVFIRGRQTEFIEAVRAFKQIKNPTWSDVNRLFKDLFQDKGIAGGSIQFHEGTIEFRAISNQQDPHDGKLQLEFLQRVFQRMPNDRVTDPQSWGIEEYFVRLESSSFDEVMIRELGLDMKEFRPLFGTNRAARLALKARYLADRDPRLLDYKIPIDLRRSLLKTGLARTLASVAYGKYPFSPKEDFSYWLRVRQLRWQSDPELSALVYKGFEHPKPHIRMAAIETLASADPQFANLINRNFLLKSLSDPGPGVSVRSFSLLSNVHDWWNIAALRERVVEILEDPELPAYVRTSAIEALARLWTRVQDLRFSIYARLSDGDPAVAMAALSRISDDSRWFEEPFLLGRVRDTLTLGTSTERAIALALLGRSRGWKAIDDLRTLVIQNLSSPDDAANEAAWDAMRAIEWWNDSALRSTVGNLLKSESQETRIRTLKGIAGSGRWDQDPVIRAEVLRTLENDRSEAQNQALRRLREVNWWRIPGVEKKIDALLRREDLYYVTQGLLQELRFQKDNRSARFPETFIRYLSAADCTGIRLQRLRTKNRTKGD